MSDVFLDSIVNCMNKVTEVLGEFPFVCMVLFSLSFSLLLILYVRLMVRMVVGDTAAHHLEEKKDEEKKEMDFIKK